ncbi:MAG: PHP domain-containing protein [Alphaproteobacteria bacterium]|nr:PHP domain-containing protein [Alphaproteobacteria bacterium]
MSILLFALMGCDTGGCLTGEEGCRVEPACTSLAFECSGGVATFSRVQPGGVELFGNTIVQSPGDWVLQNGQVYVVISDLDHPHFIAPTGGNLVDVATFAPDGTLRQDDSLRNLYQVGGLLPTEAANWQRIEAFMDGENAVVQVVGTYDDDPDVALATRYELGPCDPGLRIRTELLNGHHEPESVFLADGLYIGGRESIGFTPGLGLTHPSFGLSTLLDGIVDVPWMVSGAHEEPGSAHALVACDQESISGILSEEIIAFGAEPRLLQPGDFISHERFFGVAHGSSIAAGADLALEVRRQLFGEAYTTVTGTVTTPGDDAPDFRAGRPHVVVWKGDITPDPEDPSQEAWTHVEPGPDGAFSFRVPTGGTYTAQVERFGLPWGRATFDASGDAATLTVPMEPPGRVTLDVTVDGEADYALVVVYPADEATLAATQTKYLGHFETCAPMLGHPFGAAPSCNRVVVNGPTTLSLPPGTYDFFAAAGPFASIDVARGVSVGAVEPGTSPQDLPLALESLPILDPGMLTADFHVHGSASFDSSIPDGDRVRAFLASRLDVIAATDHDKVHDYAETLAALDAGRRLQVLVGLETTGHILQPLLDSSLFPKVVGHWIVWPLPMDPEGPWRGAPWDEKAQPGMLFTRFEDQGWPRETGVIQLNHPWGGLQFGRDFGWATALEMDLTKPLDGPDAPEGHRLFSSTPMGSRFANSDYHVQEVMNGTNNGQFLQYRAVWHYLLNQGVPHGGTANSDSHTLGGNVLGFPLNVVTTDQAVGTGFQQATFNASVKRGEMFGTNGPVVLARVVDGDVAHRPRVDVAIPPTGTLEVELRAASWVPVTEVRIYVDGELVETFDPGMADDAARPGVRSATFSRPMASLVSSGSDHWVVVEAGGPLLPFADFDCDGIPDTDDNDGDGVVTPADIEVDEGDPRPEPDDDGCFETTGPLDGIIDTLALPADDFAAVVPGGYPLSFTNPFLVDGDGNGTFEGVAR